MSIAIQTDKESEFPLRIDHVITTASNYTVKSRGRATVDDDDDEDGGISYEGEEVNKDKRADHNNNEEDGTMRTPTGSVHAGAGASIVKMFKSLSGRRLRARNNFDPNVITISERRQLAKDVCNDECGMQKMKSTTASGSGKGRKFKLKERLSQVSIAALAPRAAINKWIDPENGKENLGFYRNVIQ